jgi:hypothetical protein
MSFFEDNAIAALMLGFRVFPLYEGSKHPAVAWGTEASDDLEQIEEWARRWPNANVAAVTGAASNLIVIDVDVKDNAPGFKSMDALRQRKRLLPPGPMATTPTGGRHLYFRNTIGIRNAQGMTKSGRGLGPGIDIRAEGGMIVLPPTRIRKSEDYPGGSYRWIVPPNGWFPTLPPWAVTMLTERTPKADEWSVRRGNSPQSAEASLERIANYVANTKQGSRNATIHWATCEAVRAGAEPGLIRERILAAALACGEDRHKAINSINSGLRQGGRS